MQTALLGWMLAGCAPPSEARREQVRKIVTDNYDVLDADVETWNFTRFRQIESIGDRTACNRESMRRRRICFPDGLLGFA